MTRKQIFTVATLLGLVLAAGATQAALYDLPTWIVVFFPVCGALFLWSLLINSPPRSVTSPLEGQFGGRE